MGASKFLNTLILFENIFDAIVLECFFFFTSKTVQNKNKNEIVLPMHSHARYEQEQ